MESFYYTCNNEECKGNNIELDKEYYEDGQIYCPYCGELLVIIKETF